MIGEPDWEWHLVGACRAELWERWGKQVLSDFVGERKNRKQVLLWKCGFNNSQEDVTCAWRSGKSFAIVRYIKFPECYLKRYPKKDRVYDAQNVSIATSKMMTQVHQWISS